MRRLHFIASVLGTALTCIFFIAPPAGLTKASRSSLSPGTELSLAQALSVMPDNATTRAAGVWYTNYARAERTYRLTAPLTVTSPQIQSYFTAIRPLRVGPETGINSLFTGLWKLRYGYDLFNISSEIYTDGLSRQAYGLAVGSMSPISISAHLIANGYLAAFLPRASRLSRIAQFPLWASDSTVNNVVVAPSSLYFGGKLIDVMSMAEETLGVSPTLGYNPLYQDIELALGPITSGFIAANVPLPISNAPRFIEPAHPHAGPPLHAFSLYSVAYREPYPGDRIMKLALVYPSVSLATADAATLTDRFRIEKLPVTGRSWTSIAAPIEVGIVNNVVTVFLYLKSTVPLTFWQDVVTNGALTILSP